MAIDPQTDSSPTPEPASDSGDSNNSRAANHKPDQASRLDGTLSAGPRQWVSLAIAIHCICVGLGLLANYSPSPLLARLTNVLSPYLTSFHLTPDPSTLYSTHGINEDCPHQMELLEISDDGSGARWLPVAEFAVGLPPQQRQLRQARLLALLVEQEAEEDVARIVRDTVRWSANQGRDPRAFRLRRHVQRPADPFGGQEADYFETVYSADVLTDGTTLTIVQRTPDAEAARVLAAPAEDRQ